MITYSGDNGFKELPILYWIHGIHGFQFLDHTLHHAAELLWIFLRKVVRFTWILYEVVETIPFVGFGKVVVPDFPVSLTPCSEKMALSMTRMRIVVQEFSPACWIRFSFQKLGKILSVNLMACRNRRTNEIHNCREEVVTSPNFMANATGGDWKLLWSMPDGSASPRAIRIATRQNENP